MILKHISEAERPSLKLKIYTADALKGKRKEWGSSRKWEGNYLVNVSQLTNSTVYKNIKLHKNCKYVLHDNDIHRYL